MSEKTAEEKLREELEGKLSSVPQDKDAGKSEPVRKPVKPRAMRSRAATSKAEKLANVGQRLDSFMEDFERRIAESLNAEKVFSAGRSEKERKAVEESSAELGAVNVAGNGEAVKKAAGKMVRRRRKKTTEEPTRMHESGQPIPAQETMPEAAQPISAQETMHEPALPSPAQEPMSESALLTSAQETMPEPAQLPPAQETMPEPAQPSPAQETMPEHELPTLEQDDAPLNDIPVEIIDEPEQEIDHELDDAFPDIPVIDAQEIAETSDTTPEENTLPDIPVISPQPEELDDDFADIAKLDDDIHKFTEEHEDSSTPHEINSDFPPFADVVVNVDADLPQINSENQENSSDDFAADNFDPETLAAPVTVTMPESTKTAEDKLMANIAEAMTGSPLTLDKPDPSKPYRLPDNLLNPQNDPNSSPKSAEDKLIADISQAISESPIETAQNQANQNFEAEISPFDEMPLPEPIQTPDFDEDANEEEGDDFDEPFLPDFPAEAENDTEQQEQLHEETVDEDFADTFSILDDDNASDKAEDFSDTFSILDDDNASDKAEDFSEPFSVLDDDSSSDSPASNEDTTEDFSELPVAENDTAIDTDTPDFSELPDISLLNEPENDSESANLDVTLEESSAPSPSPELAPKTETPPENEPVTAEERLAQELADFTNQGSTNDLQPEPENEHQDPQTSEEDSGEDFNFMASWGDAASTMNYGDEEPEPQADPMPQTEPLPQTEPKTGITHTPLNFAAPAESRTEESGHTEEPQPKASPVWRIVLQSVLGLLILAGLFLLFRLHQLTDSITSMMLYGNSQSGTSAQSYDYAVDLIPDEEISSRMRLRGIEGWKLVGSRRTQDSATGRYGYEFIFMRQTPAIFEGGID